MIKSMEQLLIDCLEALDRGEAIGEILSRYPVEAAELRPILETAARLTTLSLQPTIAAQTKSREAFLAQAEAIGGLVPRRRPFFSFWLRPFAAVAVLIILAFGFINISARTLPGDALYGAKLFWEGTQLRLTGDGASLKERFRQNRIVEIENLLQQNREAQVTFTGVIDEMMDDTWRIEGLLVVVAAAEKSGDPYVGDVVEVSGWVGNGRLVANTIIVTVKSETPPTLTPAATEISEPTTTVEPIATSTPTETSTPTTTSSSTPTPTLTPSPTATATPSLAAATPEPHPDPVPTSDNSGSGSGNSGSGSNNSGSGSGDDNSGSGSNNSGSGSSNSGSGSGNSGSGSNNSGSGSGNSGSGSGDGKSGSGGDNDD